MELFNGINDMGMFNNGFVNVNPAMYPDLQQQQMDQQQLMNQMAYQQQQQQSMNQMAQQQAIEQQNQQQQIAYQQAVDRQNQLAQQIAYQQSIDQQNQQNQMNYQQPLMNQMAYQQVNEQQKSVVKPEVSKEAKSNIQTDKKEQQKSVVKSEVSKEVKNNKDNTKSIDKDENALRHEFNLMVNSLKSNNIPLENITDMFKSLNKDIKDIKSVLKSEAFKEIIDNNKDINNNKILISNKIESLLNNKSLFSNNQNKKYKHPSYVHISLDDSLRNKCNEKGVIFDIQEDVSILDYKYRYSNINYSSPIDYRGNILEDPIMKCMNGSIVEAMKKYNESNNVPSLEKLYDGRRYSCEEKLNKYIKDNYGEYARYAVLVMHTDTISVFLDEYDVYYKIALVPKNTINTTVYDNITDVISSL